MPWALPPPGPTPPTASLIYSYSSHSDKSSVEFTCSAIPSLLLASLAIISCSFYVVLMFAAQSSGDIHPGPHPLPSPPAALRLPQPQDCPGDPGTFQPCPEQASLILSCSLQELMNKLTASAQLRCTKAVTLKCADVCRWLLRAEPELKGILPGLRHKHHIYIFFLSEGIFFMLVVKCGQNVFSSTILGHAEVFPSLLYMWIKIE